MNIIIKNIYDGDFILNANEEDTIEQLKLRIKGEKCILPENQILIYNYKHLDNEKPLSYYSIKNYSVICLVNIENEKEKDNEHILKLKNTIENDNETINNMKLDLKDQGYYEFEFNFEENKDIFSSEFKIGSYKWKVQLLYYSSIEKLYIYLRNINNEEFMIKSNILIRNKDNLDQYVLLQPFSYYYYNTENEKDYKKDISKKDFKSLIQPLLGKNNKLIMGIYIYIYIDSKANYINKLKSLIPQNENNCVLENEGYYEWTIDNINEVDKYGIESPKFILNNEEWLIMFYKDWNGYVKIQLQKWNFFNMPSNRNLYFNCVFSLQSENSNSCYVAKALPLIQCVNKNNGCIEFDKFIKTQDLSLLKTEKIILNLYLCFYNKQPSSKENFIKIKENQNSKIKESEEQKKIEKERMEKWENEAEKEIIKNEKDALKKEREIIYQKESELRAEKEIIYQKENELRAEKENICQKKNELKVENEIICQKKNELKVENEIICQKKNELKAENEIICKKKNELKVEKENIWIKENEIKDECEKLVKEKLQLIKEKTLLECEKKDIRNIKLELEKIKKDFNSQKINMNNERNELINELKAKEFYIKECEDQISQLNNKNTELKTEQYKNEIYKLVKSKGTEVKNYKNDYFEWDIDYCHNFQNIFSSEIITSGYKWKIKLYNDQDEYLSLKFYSVPYFSLAEEMDFNFASCVISIRNMNDFSCFIAKAPDLLQHMKIGNNSVKLKKLFKKEDLLKINPKFNNNYIIENNVFVLGIYIHLYEYKEVEQKNEVISIECPICLEKASKDTKLSVTICGHVFCKTCINEFLKFRKSCPICRKNIKINNIFDIFF
ncbi:hypothetical protein BCR36DRAFT_337797 [Piromyces finnis]|uniref:Ubiquitin-like domain-containing protein n=1 Tax=Piromyces finnis TaxID=1754191 RepID=A0A1Y1UVZ1_9FUNG|nr:hypothetical protein BCR36DRAFT_337797 [Piromyces finnis]|eukprot:ORX42195.1 hypothetical protein BCR36DRAFT_337797 [Piromyces finnis]